MALARPNCPLCTTVREDVCIESFKKGKCEKGKQANIIAFAGYCPPNMGNVMQGAGMNYLSTFFAFVSSLII